MLKVEEKEVEEEEEEREKPMKSQGKCWSKRKSDSCWCYALVRLRYTPKAIVFIECISSLGLGCCGLGWFWLDRTGRRVLSIGLKNK